MNKFSLVVEVRLIKGKIDHPPIFKKIRYFSDPDCVFSGSQTATELFSDDEMERSLGECLWM